MNSTFNIPADSPLATHIELLLQLDRQMQAGEDENADILRDLMDVSWYQMSDEERRIAAQLSCDLLTLQDSPEIRHPTDPAVFEPSLAKSLGLRKDNGDYLGVLQLLSEHPDQISAVRAATIRGMCYEHFGLPEVGLLFDDRAIEVADDLNTVLTLSFSILMKLSRIGRTDEALAKVNQLIDALPESPIEFLIAQGDFRYDRALCSKGEDKGKGLHSAIESYSQALTRLSSQRQTRPLRWGSASYCEAKISVCWMLLGNTKVAMLHANEAIHLEPDDAFLYVHRGLLASGTNFAAAIEDFEKAAKLSSDSHLPYYYLAVAAFRSEDFTRCMHWARTALQKKPDREVASKLYELLAISTASSADSLDESTVSDIRKFFVIAMSLAPGSQRIFYNSKLFDDAISHAVPARKWQSPPADDPFATAVRFSAQRVDYSLIGVN